MASTGIPMSDIERFHLKLMEAIEEWPGFGKLPPKAASASRIQRLFHICYVRHYVNPEDDRLEPEDSENWILAVDHRAAWLVAIPEEFCPEGIDPLERVRNRLETGTDRIRDYAKRYEAMYGKFQVKQRDGGIYVRHSGFVNREVPPMDVYE